MGDGAGSQLYLEALVGDDIAANKTIKCVVKCSDQKVSRVTAELEKLAYRTVLTKTGSQ